MTEKSIKINAASFVNNSINGELAQSVKRPSVEPKIPGSTPTQADD